jgi:hypothetical protein
LRPSGTGSITTSGLNKPFKPPTLQAPLKIVSQNTEPKGSPASVSTTADNDIEIVDEHQPARTDADHPQCSSLSLEDDDIDPLANLGFIDESSTTNNSPVILSQQSSTNVLESQTAVQERIKSTRYSSPWDTECDVDGEAVTPGTTLPVSSAKSMTGPSLRPTTAEEKHTPEYSGCRPSSEPNPSPDWEIVVDGATYHSVAANQPDPNSNSSQHVIEKAASSDVDSTDLCDDWQVDVDGAKPPQNVLARVLGRQSSSINLNATNKPFKAPASVNATKGSEVIDLSEPSAREQSRKWFYYFPLLCDRAIVSSHHNAGRGTARGILYKDHGTAVYNYTQYRPNLNCRYLFADDPLDPYSEHSIKYS